MFVPDDKGHQFLSEFKWRHCHRANLWKQCRLQTSRGISETHKTDWHPSVADLEGLLLPWTTQVPGVRIYPRKAVTSRAVLEPSSSVNTKHIMHGHHALFWAWTQKRMETEAGIHVSNCSPVDGNDSGGCVITRPQDPGGLFIIPTSAK